MKTKIILVAVVGLFLILGIGMATGYNHLIDLEEDVSFFQGEIDLRLEQRHDELGLLVTAVNGLQEHAESVYQMVTDARAAYAAAKAAGDQAAMIEADALEALAITSLIAVVEDNDLVTAESGYVGFMIEVASIEASLAYARREYNKAVAEYNAEVRKFPRVLYASLLGFAKSFEYWKMNDGADEVPDVVFE